MYSLLLCGEFYLFLDLSLLSQNEIVSHVQFVLWELYSVMPTWSTWVLQVLKVRQCLCEWCWALDLNQTPKLYCCSPTNLDKGAITGIHKQHVSWVMFCSCDWMICVIHARVVTKIGIAWEVSLYTELKMYQKLSIQLLAKFLVLPKECSNNLYLV